MKTKKAKRKFKEVRIGASSSKLCRVVYDLGDIPQDLFPGTHFVSTKDMQYADKTFQKGTEMVFVNYAVEEFPSSSNKYDSLLYRVAVFQFKGDLQNRIATADEITASNNHNHLE
jgi:hypothetical protein